MTNEELQQLRIDFIKAQGYTIGQAEDGEMHLRDRFGKIIDSDWGEVGFHTFFHVLPEITLDNLHVLEENLDGTEWKLYRDAIYKEVFDGRPMFPWVIEMTFLHVTKFTKARAFIKVKSTNR